MPQRPAKRHVLADVRIECDLTQANLAKMLGCAPVSVQKIEQGALELSEDLAQRAESELDVSASYLLANDPERKAVTPRGGLWTKELYELAQGARSFAKEEKPTGLSFRLRRGPRPLTEASNEFVAWKTEDFTARIHALLEGTKDTPKQGILVHRLNKSLDSLLEDFQPDETTLAKYEPRLKKLRAAYDAAAKRIADEEHDRIWREEQTR